MSEFNSSNHLHRSLGLSLHRTLPSMPATPFIQMRVHKLLVFRVLWLLASPPTPISRTRLQLHGASTGSVMAAVNCVFDVLSLTTTQCNVFLRPMVRPSRFKQSLQSKTNRVQHFVRFVMLAQFPPCAPETNYPCTTYC